MMRSSSARSSGSWPVARGLRSFGMHVHVGAGHVQVAAQHERLARGRELGGVGVHRLEETHLGGEVLAAVGHVDRRHGGLRQPHRDDALLEVERRMQEARRLHAVVLPHQQPDARVALAAVPVRPVALGVGEPQRQLIERRLDLLQAQHVGALALEQVLQLRLAGADAVHVPGGNLHRGALESSNAARDAGARATDRSRRNRFLRPGGRRRPARRRRVARGGRRPRALCRTKARR